MTEQSGGETGLAAGIGTRLRGARERSGLTLEQAAQKLHVAPAVLAALESEDFGALGAPIYVKSYLGRYAELLGESPESLRQLLSNAVVIPEPDLTRIPHVRADRSRLVGRIVNVAVVVAVVLLIVTSLWWGLSHWHGRGLALRGWPAAGHKAAAPLTAASGAAPVHPAAKAAHAVAPAPGDKGHSAAAAASTAGAVRITLKFAAPSWVEVDDAAGQQLYRALAPAAAVRTVRGSAPLHVVLGYAPGVVLAVNGHVVPITAFVESDHAASFVIKADGRVLSGPRAGGE